jgi:hypothetical protein
VQFLACLSDGVYLCVGSGVAVWGNSVGTFGYDFAVFYYDGSEWSSAFIYVFDAQAYGSLHEFVVVFHTRKWVCFLICYTLLYIIWRVRVSVYVAKYGAKI